MIPRGSHGEAPGRCPGRTAGGRIPHGTIRGTDGPGPGPTPGIHGIMIPGTGIRGITGLTTITIGTITGTGRDPDFHPTEAISTVLAS